MSRHFYLLCLLFATKDCFCYSYLDDSDLKFSYNPRPFRKDKNHHPNRFEEKQNSGTHPAYEVVDAKDPVAQIDVASFIRKPDEYAVEDNSLYETETKKRLNKIKPYKDNSYYHKHYPNDDLKRANKLLHANSIDGKIMKSNGKSVSYENSATALYPMVTTRGHRWDQKKSVRNFENKPLVNNHNHPRGVPEARDSAIHKPEKKCALKNFKFPFFSHSKDPLKLKKNKKRKIFCFNCAKKDNQEISSEAPDGLKENAKKESVRSPVITRGKREEDQAWMSDKDRQLKEIEEIEKKIDRVQVKSTNKSDK